MSVSELSPSSQNYLKTIWALQEWDHEPVAPSVLAARLGLRPSTVSDGVRKLASQSLVEHTPYGAISLTPEGHKNALAMVRRHRLIETFLVQVLHYSWDQVHEEADQLEHAVSDFMVDRIDELLGHPTRDPHGDPIPQPDGSLHTPEAFTLADLATGSRIRIERISDDDPELLQYLADQGIGIGSELDLEPGAPFSESLTARSGDTAVVLGSTALSAIWASVITTP